MNNDNRESFLSATMRSAENIISKSADSARYYLNGFKELREKRQNETRRVNPAPMADSVPGKVFADIMLVVGWVFFGLSFLVGLMEFFILPSGLWMYMLFPLVIGLILIIISVRRLRYIEIYQTFWDIFSDSPYIKVTELAQKTGMSKFQVVRYLKKYQNAGLYPKGHFAENGTYYVMSDTAERMLNDEFEKQEQIKRERYLQSQYPKLYAVTSQLDETIDALYAFHFSETGSENPELKREMFDMGHLMYEIKDYIERNPQSVPDINGFIDYFLPTVTKLLGTYCELENEPIETENIRASKAEIESVLGSINTAFVNMYDDFFTDKAIDVYADVSVLKTMIKQHGFSDSDF